MINNHESLKNGMYGPEYDNYLNGHVTVWYKDGKIHNEHGPAMTIDREGRIEKSWALDGVEYTEKEFQDKLKENLSDKLAQELQNKPIIKQKKI